MDRRFCYRILASLRTVCAAGLLIALSGLGTGSMAWAQENQDSLPPSVTTDMIAEGSELFTGAGLCMACHGADAKGLPNLGPSLADTTWIHNDGSYEQIVAQILTGVPAGESQSGIMMPPKGGSSLSEEQVRAVAAYVWSLRRNDGTQ